MFKYRYKEGGNEHIWQRGEPIRSANQKTMIERYTREAMKAIWSDEHKFSLWLTIELLTVEAWVASGVVPPEDYERIKQHARLDLKRIAELEAETRHDVIAFTRQISETLGEERRWVHYGLTSSDIIDTALMLQVREANRLIWDGLVRLERILSDLALRYKRTVMIGRTHGVHAEPTTFGLKALYWREAVRRHMTRFRELEERLYVGKLSGAVGTYTQVTPEVEQYVLSRLGLAVAPVVTQTLPRDLHAEYMAYLALVGTTLETIAVELRHLQRTEVREVEEGFAPGQKGSSAMPHKKNPISAENITGLSRLLRGYMVSAYESVALWHERDISHSSVERVIFPDATILLDYMLARLSNVLSHLVVHTERMRNNMDRGYHLYFSSQVLKALIEQGWSRETAYDTVQRLALRAWEEEKNFPELVMGDATLREVLSEETLRTIFDEGVYIRHIDTIFKRAKLSED